MHLPTLAEQLWLRTWFRDDLVGIFDPQQLKGVTGSRQPGASPPAPYA
jgi:hypothetical protein